MSGPDDPDTPDDWRKLARCAEPDVIADDWFPEHAGVRTKVHMRAVHLCREHCPVLAECHAEAKATPTTRRRNVVLGGVTYDRNGDRAADGPPTRCPQCPPKGK